MIDIRSEDRSPFPGFGTDPKSVRLRLEALERLLTSSFLLPVPVPHAPLLALAARLLDLDDSTGAPCAGSCSVDPHLACCS